MENNIPKELYNAAGIYEIRNLITGKVYVGSTTNFSKRQRGHKSSLIRHKQTNGRLFNAYLKYGIDAFSFTVLHELKQDSTESKADFVARLLLKEYEYIDKLGANIREKGYNIRIDPETNFGAKLPRRVQATTSPKPNQSLGSLNNKAVINESIAKEIKLLLQLGYAPSTIAKTLLVSVILIGEIKRGKTWKHVILSDEDIRHYQPGTLTRGRNSLSVLEVKQIRFLLSMGYPATPISLFFKAPHHVAKSIRLGKGYRTILLTDEESQTFKSGDMTKKFNLFLIDYNNKGTKNRAAQMQVKAARKLTSNDVLKIKDRLLSGEKPDLIAQDFPITVGNVCCIARGQTWAHLTGLKPGDVALNGKLTSVQKQEILTLLCNGSKGIDIAGNYNVSPSAISYLRNKAS